MAEGSKSGGYWLVVLMALSFLVFFSHRKRKEERRTYVFGQNFTFRHGGLERSLREEAKVVVRGGPIEIRNEEGDSQISMKGFFSGCLSKLRGAR